MKKRGGKNKRTSTTPNPFDLDAKPIIAFTELEDKRFGDELGLMLEKPMLDDARAGKGSLLVAAAVLVLPSGAGRLLCYGGEPGDGEGSILPEHTVVLASRALKRGESVRLDFIDVTIATDGACSWAVHAGEGVDHEAHAGEILAPSMPRKLARARSATESESADFWLVVLTTEAGDKRVVYFDVDDGVGDNRAACADIVRRARRLKWLQPGESIDRVHLMVQLADADGWKAIAVADPVPVAGG